jgi:hypothetical protein
MHDADVRRQSLPEPRDEADRTAAEAAHTLAELNRRLTAVRRPREAARRLAADARVTALRAVREGAGMIAGQRGAWRPVLAAIPVLAAAAVLAYATPRGKIRWPHPDGGRAS